VLNLTAVPLKIVSGGDSVDLDPAHTSIKYLSNTVEYDNIYTGTLNTTGVYASVDLASAAAIAAPYTYITQNPVSSLTGPPANTRAFTFWSTTNTPQNSILDEGEHATLVVAYNDADRPSALDKIRIEVSLPTGAALTVERQVPNISYDIVDLG